MSYSSGGAFDVRVVSPRILDVLQKLALRQSIA